MSITLRQIQLRGAQIFFATVLILYSAFVSTFSFFAALISIASTWAELLQGAAIDLIVFVLNLMGSIISTRSSLIVDHC